MVGYTLIIAEKPQSATRIAEALAEGKPRRLSRYGAYWLEFKRDGKKHVCVPAVGHLFVLNTKKGEGWKYPTFDVEWVPTFTQKGSEFTRKYYRNIEDLAKHADDIIVATDYDVEGEVISFNILRYLCKRSDAKRMKFSTLVKSELVEAYKNMMPHIDFGQAEAGLTRHYLDAYWGFNTTRALTLAMREFLKNVFILVSSGRVQSPTLKILTERELEIRKFVPTPFWQVELVCIIGGQEFVAMYAEEKLWDKKDAERIVNECKGKDAKVEKVRRKSYKQLPPFPFDTTTLQTEAYNQFKFSPRRTMSIAEGLYNQGLISYPRTASQKLPSKIDYKKIIQALSRIRGFKEDCELLSSMKTLKPREGPKSDPAHPSIFPTGEIPKKLRKDEQNLYELIVRRFFSLFGAPVVREIMKVNLNIAGHPFILTGKRTIEPGWTKFYGKFVKLEEQILPDMKEGESVKVKEVRLLEKETQPPKRYTQGSIIKEMEKKGLGTRATRAEILQTLYDRGYIRGKSIEVTEFGEKVVEVLSKYCPKIVSEELTRKFEEEMELVRQGKKRREEVIEEAKAILTEILDEFKKNEKKIGEILSKAYISFKRGEKIIGKCPSCGSELRIIRSRRSGKRFIGCSKFPECKTAFPLPQFGEITVLGKECKECGMPMIRVKVGKKRAYTMCINPECRSKTNWKAKTKVDK